MNREMETKRMTVHLLVIGDIKGQVGGPGTDRKKCTPLALGSSPKAETLASPLYESCERGGWGLAKPGTILNVPSDPG